MLPSHSLIDEDFIVSNLGRVSTAWGPVSLTN